MKKSTQNFSVLVLAVSVLAGCGKDVPSCGEPEATNLVSEILAKSVAKDTGVMEEDFKKRVHFEVEQPVVLAHDEKVSSYQCKGVATYKLPNEVLEALQRTNTDKAYEVKLWSNWRKLMGLHGLDEIDALTKELANPATTEQRKQGSREELAEILGVDKNTDDRMLIGMIVGFPLAQRNKQITENANLITKVIAAADEGTRKVPVEIKYTISKIDGQGKQFKVEVESPKNLISGIQNLEVLNSAAQSTNQPQVGAAKPVEAQPVATQAVEAQSPAAQTQPAATATQASPSLPQQAEEKQPEQKTAGQPVPETKPQAVSQPEPQKGSIEASFDCAKASSQIEKLICSSPETANADKRLAAAYTMAKAKATDQQKFKTEQQQWMKQERNSCNDAACLMKITEDRIQKLSSQQ